MWAGGHAGAAFNSDMIVDTLATGARPKPTDAAGNGGFLIIYILSYYDDESNAHKHSDPL